MKMKAPAKCPTCGHRPKPLPNPRRERLQEQLGFLTSDLSYLSFEHGRAFEAEQEHRLALMAILRTDRKLAREQKRLRIKIAGIKKKLEALT